MHLAATLEFTLVSAIRKSQERKSLEKNLKRNRLQFPTAILLKSVSVSEIL